MIEDRTPPTVEERKPRWKLRLTRDSVTYVIAIGGILHELLLTDTERPFLLGLFAAMLGLPAVLRADERGKRD